MDIFKGLLTPVIAIVTTYIAWQQWKINQQKLDFEKYNRRLRIYEKVKEILDIVMRNGKVSGEDLLKYRESVSEADFLFDSEIIDYINEIYNRGLNLRKLNLKYKDYTERHIKDYDYEKLVDEMDKELKWFLKQSEIAKEKFKNYLYFGN